MARKTKAKQSGRIQLPKGSTANERAKARTDYAPSLAKAFPVLQKFLVVSYDKDEKQWFYDIVYAVSEDAAGERICNIRPYVIDVDVFTFYQVERLAREVSQVTREKSEAWLASIAEESGQDDEAPEVG